MKKSAAVHTSLLAAAAAAMMGCGGQAAHLNAAGQCVSNATNVAVSPSLCSSSGHSGGQAYYGGSQGAGAQAADSGTVRGVMGGHAGGGE